MSTYEDYQVDQSPEWLQDERGAAWARVHGRLHDATLSAAKDAVLARFVGSAPADALPWIGRERMIPRFPGDSDATYRARLARAQEIWQKAGTSAGIVALLNEIGFDTVAIYTARDALPPGEASWPPDGDLDNWSRFWVFLDVETGANPFDWQSVAWGTLPWGSGWTWGSTATPAQVALVRRIIRTFKAAHEVCAGIYVDLPGGPRLRWQGME